MIGLILAALLVLTGVGLIAALVGVIRAPIPRSHKLFRKEKR
jgi:hypothetical protein